MSDTESKELPELTTLLSSPINSMSICQHGQYFKRAIPRMQYTALKVLTLICAKVPETEAIFAVHSLASALHAVLVVLGDVIQALRVAASLRGDLHGALKQINDIHHAIDSGRILASESTVAYFVSHYANDEHSSMPSTLDKWASTTDLFAYTLSGRQIPALINSLFQELVGVRLSLKEIEVWCGRMRDFVSADNKRHGSTLSPLRKAFDDRVTYEPQRCMETLAKDPERLFPGGEWVTKWKEVKGR